MSFLVPQKGDSDYVERVAPRQGRMQLTHRDSDAKGKLNGRPFGCRADGTPLAVEQDKPELYRAMVRQLVHDGYVDAAESLVRSTGVVVPHLHRDGDRLEQLVQLGLSSDAIRTDKQRRFEGTYQVENILNEAVFYDHTMSPLVTTGLHEDFTTTQLAPLRASCFSFDGRFIACGSINGAVRVFSLEGFREGRKLNPRPIDRLGEASTFETNWALARQYTDHTQSVEWLAFSPANPTVLASGGRDGALRLRDISTPNCPSVNLLPEGKPLNDTYPIRCGAFHPGGNYLFYGTDHDTVRMLDMSTGEFYAAGGAGAEVRHTAGITDLALTSDGRLLATASYDGSINLHTTVDGRGVWSGAKAHSSVPVTSAVFSRSDNILLTAGMDSQIRMWDLRKNNCEISLFGTSAKVESKVKARFDCTERCIVTTDNTMKSVQIYDIFSGKVTASLLHNQEQRTFACSPTELTIATGGDDSRLRLWNPAL